MALSIEPAAEVQQRICQDCGRPFSTVHGFIYEDGDAYAVYHALLQTEHPSTQVGLALSLGSWEEGATGSDRQRIGLRVWREGSESKMHVENAEESGWGHSDAFGTMLDRDQVLQGVLRDEAFRATEFVVEHDDRIRGHLDRL